jgi:predicted enzyme related to lactoylglutathione lyase
VHLARITGIGGVFIKSAAKKETSAWYDRVLGLKLEPWGGGVLRWPEDTAEDRGATAWNLAGEGGDWFPGPVMINYRVDSMDGMIARLAENGVPVLKGPEYHENGVFLWLMDPDGRKVELWEPKKWDAANKR